jgi:hypothetical protein
MRRLLAFVLLALSGSIAAEESERAVVRDYSLVRAAPAPRTQ